MAWWSGRGAEARQAAARAVEVLEERGTRAGNSRWPTATGRSYTCSPTSMVEAVEWGTRARDLADRLGDLETSIHASMNVSAARLNGGDETAASALRDAHATASAAGLAEHAARALVCVSASHLHLRGSTTPRGRAERGAWLRPGSRSRRLHPVPARGQGAHPPGAVRLGRGACRRGARVVWPNRIGIAVVMALVARGRILAARGDPDALSTLDIAADARVRHRGTAADRSRGRGPGRVLSARRATTNARPPRHVRA